MKRATFRSVRFVSELVATCHLESTRETWSLIIMDAFQQCVEDLGTIERMLELPHGYDIACEMFRELGPYLKQLAAITRHDPTGGVKIILEYAEKLRRELNIVDSQPVSSAPAELGKRCA